MSVARAEARAAEIIATSRVKLGPDIVAITAAGDSGTEEEYRAALAVALAAGDWKPRPLYDVQWKPVPGGAIKRDGNLIHLQFGDTVPATDLLPDDEPTEPKPSARHDPETGVLDLGRRLARIDFDPDAAFVPPSWLAKGLLPRRGIGLLFGESGAGKSFAAIHAAVCVAYGLPLFGRKVKGGGVLYVAAEGGASVAGRFRAANDAMRPQLAAARLSGERPKRAPISIVTEAPDLSRDGDPKALLRTIRDAERDFEAAGHRLALVVIDTWHAAMGGGDENSAADAGAALAPLRSAAEDSDFLCLIVHHPGKDVERGARGSNALPAAADAIIAVSVPGFDKARAKPSNALRHATITKMRDGEAGVEFHYRLPVVQMGVDEDGDPITTCRVEPAEPVKLDDEGLSKNDRTFMEAVRAALAEAAGDRVSVKELRLRFNASRPDAKPEANRVAFGRALSAAVKGGRIAVDDTEEWAWAEQA